MDYFRTERLVVRSFEENDAQFLFDYFEKPLVNCFLDEKLNSLQEAEKEVSKRSTDKSQYAVCLPDDTLIGNLFAYPERDDDTFGVGCKI